MHTGKILYPADKPVTLLACRLAPRPRCRTVPKIRQPDGSFTQNPQKILNLFHSYFTSLCKEPETLKPGAIDDFIKDLPLPSLSDSRREIMDGAITMEEVMSAIKQAHASMTPGPDGFSASYKKLPRY